VPPGAWIRVGCVRCCDETSLGTLEPPELECRPEAGLDFAMWLTEHRYSVPGDIGHEAKGCRLVVDIIPAGG